MRVIVFRALLILLMLCLGYGVYSYFQGQKQKKVLQALNQIEQIRLSIFQEYHAVRNLSLLDKNNPDNDVKIDTIILLLEKSPDWKLLKSSEIQLDDKVVEDLITRYDPIQKKKRYFLEQHKEQKDLESEELEQLQIQYEELLKQFQEVSSHLKKEL